jgi:hypothetical protein
MHFEYNSIQRMVNYSRVQKNCRQTQDFYENRTNSFWNEIISIHEVFCALSADASFRIFLCEWNTIRQHNFVTENAVTVFVQFLSSERSFKTPPNKKVTLIFWWSATLQQFLKVNGTVPRKILWFALEMYRYTGERSKKNYRFSLSFLGDHRTDWHSTEKNSIVRTWDALLNR